MILFVQLSYINSELQNGIAITSESGEVLGSSTQAAQKAIFQVVTSRIAMAIPAMGELCFYTKPKVV